MRLFGLIGLIAIAGLLAACRTTPDEVVTATPPRTGYPAPLPSPSPLEGGYPAAPATPTLPTDAYPESSTVWVTHPAGLQCETPQYPDLASAVDALEDAGVEVLEGEEYELLTCEACTCPTSTHYRLRIPSADLTAAAALDWEPER